MINLELKIDAHRFGPEYVPVANVEIVINADADSMCSVCRQKLNGHGVLFGRIVCPGDWIINGREIMTDAEFMEKFGATPTQEKSTPWN